MRFVVSSVARARANIVQNATEPRAKIVQLLERGVFSWQNLKIHERAGKILGLRVIMSPTTPILVNRCSLFCVPTLNNQPVPAVLAGQNSTKERDDIQACEGF